MTSKTELVLRTNKLQGRKNLIGYFPLGYPTLEQSIEAAISMCHHGVDVLELGIPYSDPVMDGPVIQEATQEALAAGFKLTQTFAAVTEISAAVSAPVLVMTYWNPVLQYGVERFATELAAAGGAGLITPDLIPDEAAEWLAISERLELDRVFLATPTSSQSRVNTAVSKSRGFTYAVSTMGITGAREELDAMAKSVVAKINAVPGEHLAAVGIGVSTATQVEEINDYADAAIVGSAFVRAYQQGSLTALVDKVIELKGN